MKNLLVYFCLAAIFGMAKIHNPSEMGDTIPVIIIPGEEDDTPGNRGPGTVPINCYVDAASDFAVVSFTNPCGMVRVSFNNLSDGSYYSTSVNGTGAVVIPLTLTSGSWTVTFELSNGTVYNGEFTI
jgi:hypothetical protein